MRTNLTSRCDACDVRLSARATWCPFCGWGPVPAFTQQRGPRKRHWSNHAGRWVRKIAATLLLIALFVIGVGPPLALVVALFLDRSILAVLAVGMAIAGVSLVLLLSMFTVLAGLAVLWIALLPVAYFHGARTRPTRAVSVRSEPPPRRLAVGHRLVRAAKVLQSRSDEGALTLWSLVMLNGALIVAMLVTWIRGIPFVDGWSIFGGALILSFVIAFGMGFLVIGVQWAANWLVSPPGLERPPEEHADDVEAVLAERRRADRLEGTIHARGEALRAPVTGSSCVAARVRGTIDGSQIDDALAVELVLDTAEGPVAIVGDDLLVAIAAFDAPRDALDHERWLEPRGIVPREVSVTEARLEDGARVIVYGRAERALVTDDGYRGAQRERVVALHADAGPILIERAASV